ncbi:hypothetical protein [Urbifossiella limnaea]|uniref:Uncharacterized protein n=1 Tax=Urbifossiella limnaea TaxID=2528023 RepID=A0A517XQX0_9BACT|nr:hypothetical protein [Urbifossiella limnaea]QDU19871.1 hypothetical protein ETAA1_18090 [Urbifossiella limnaea]
MGIVICPKHGHGFLYNCPHLVAAVVAHSPLPGVEYLEYAPSDDPAFLIGCWYCPACVAAHCLPPSGSVPFDSEKFPEGVSPLLQPMCPECFRQWRAAGLGSRQDAEPGAAADRGLISGS